MLINSTLPNRANADFEPTPERIATIIPQHILDLNPTRLKDGESFMILETCIGRSDAGTIEFYGWESAYRLANARHPNGDCFEPPRNARTGHQLHLEQLAEQIDHAAPDYGLAESSLAALELCEVAYLSAERGCLVRLPLPQFSLPPPNDWRTGQPYSGSGGGRDGRTLP